MLHISKLVEMDPIKWGPLSLKKIYVDLIETSPGRNDFSVYSLGECLSCGRIVKMYSKKDNMCQCGKELTPMMEETKDCLLRDLPYMNIGLSLPDIYRVEISETAMAFIAKFRDHHRNPAKDCWPARMLVESLVGTYGIIPVGKIDGSKVRNTLAVRCDRIRTISQFFGSDLSGVSGYFQLLTSDARFASENPLKGMYSTEYETQMRTDGEGLLARRHAPVLKNGRAVRHCQFRIGTGDIIAKGKFVVVRDDDSRLNGLDFVVGANCVKIGKATLEEGSIIEGYVHILNIDPAGKKSKRVSWETSICFDYSNPEVNSLVDQLVTRKGLKLIRKYLVDRVGMANAMFNPNKTEHEQDYTCQLLRSSLPDYAVKPILVDMLLSKFIDVAMDCGIESKQYFASRDPYPGRKGVREATAIRVPVGPGARAMILTKIMRNGDVFVTEYDPDNSGLDFDGDYIKVVTDKLSEKLILDHMIDPGDDVHLEYGFKIVRDSRPCNIENLKTKFIEQVYTPSIGIGATQVAECMEKVGCTPERRRKHLYAKAVRGWSNAHYAAQVLKKTLATGDGAVFPMYKYIGVSLPSYTDHGRRIGKFFEYILEEHKTIGITHIMSAFNERYFDKYQDKWKGHVTSDEGDQMVPSDVVKPYSYGWRVIRNLRILTALYNSIKGEYLPRDANGRVITYKTTVDSWDKTGKQYQLFDKYNKIYKPIVSSYQTDNGKLDVMSKGSTLYSESKKKLNARWGELSKSWTTEQLRAVLIGQLYSDKKQSALANVVFSHCGKSIGDIVGYLDGINTNGDEDESSVVNVSYNWETEMEDIIQGRINLND